MFFFQCLLVMFVESVLVLFLFCSASCILRLCLPLWIIFADFVRCVIFFIFLLHFLLSVLID